MKFLLSHATVLRLYKLKSIIATNLSHEKQQLWLGWNGLSSVRFGWAGLGWAGFVLARSGGQNGDSGV